ncbi:MAG: universal stress protein [Nocardioides sp.]|uniref:universal stress protein n=1 Tax=Nocardioides sp. TaxID=35761 RepID=UPI0039E64232
MSAIITGVDGSDTAADAALAAARLASALDVELVVVCAFDKLEYEEIDTGDQTFEFTTAEWAHNVATRAIVPLKRAYPDLQAAATSAQGKPADVLLQTAAEHDADLIVVGNKRVQGVSRILGSIAADVARHATCDVYVANTHRR